MSSKIIGQRWLYLIGNHAVLVDNAYDTSGWGQERMLVDGTQVHSSHGAGRFDQQYKEPWLTNLGDATLEIDLRSGLFSVGCTARLNGAVVEHERYYTAQWSGPHLSWPNDGDWVETKYAEPEFSIMRYLAKTSKRLISSIFG